MLKNKAVDDEQLKYLNPELKEVDYFFIIDTEDDTFPIENLYHCLNDLNSVQYLLSIDINNLKSKDNLIF
jgi:hypothetical protein